MNQQAIRVGSVTSGSILVAATRVEEATVEVVVAGVAVEAAAVTDTSSPVKRKTASSNKPYTPADQPFFGSR